MKKKGTYKRPNWDEYFLEIVDSVAKRATCDRGRTAAVIVKNNRILTTGYAGAPAGLPHCDDVGHMMKKVYNPDGTYSQHCIRTNHAEENAITQAAKHGISIDGATLYCLMAPCFTCAKMIINAGIKRVVTKKRYHGDQFTAKAFEQAGIKFEVIEDSLMKYDNM